MNRDPADRSLSEKATPETPRPDRGPVLVVVPNLAIGGTERHLLAVLPRLKNRGFAIEVITLRGRCSLDEEMRARGVAVTNTPSLLPGRANTPVGGLCLLRRALQMKHGIVHFFLPEAYLVGGMTSLCAGTQKRIMSRRSLNDYQRGKPLSRSVESWLHRRMDAVVGNSHAVVAQLAAEGVPQDRLAMIHNGINVNRFVGQDRTAARNSLELEPETLVLSIVANLLPYKGHADLLQALGQAAGRLPANWRLLVAGRDEGIGGELRSQAERLGIGDQVIWLGESGAVPAVLAASDICLLASHEEGFPNAILEGMAAALPVIATGVGGCGEAVEHGITGRLVPPLNPTALAEAIVELAGDAEKRAAMGRAGRARVAERFSIEGCVDAYERLYDSVLSGNALPTIQYKETAAGHGEDVGRTV